MASQQMFLLCLCFIVTLTSSEETGWWKNQVFYQIYPLSFKDSDNNGLGDIKGITDKLQHVADLGAAGVWINPIFNSSFFDGGYDITNYTSILPYFGNMDDLKSLIKKAHDLGLKILLDLVPNHTSKDHKWFTLSEKGDKKYRDYYVWSSESPFKQNPSNWRSLMGGSAWEYSPIRKQYYYHAFLKQQPDLNYRNQDVIQEIKDIMKFYLDMGVDGFRVDAVPYLVEDQYLRDEPTICSDSTYDCLIHIYTANLNDTYKVLADLFSYIQNYNSSTEKVMFLEATVGPEIISNYYTFEKNRTSTMPFNFDLLGINKKTDAQQLDKLIRNYLDHVPQNCSPNWQLGNHDNTRIASKMGYDMVDAMNFLNILLPGVSFTYYGEEIGMINLDLLQKIDIRFNYRTPMQWTNEKNAGFSKGRSGFRMHPNSYKINVDKEKEKTPSHLTVYKDLVALKRRFSGNDTIISMPIKHQWIYNFERYSSNGQRFVVLINLNNDIEKIKLSDVYNVTSFFINVASANSNRSISQSENVEYLALRPYEALVLSSGQFLLHPSILLIAISTFIALKNR